MFRVSADEFRDLRHCCLLNPKACAEYLGVSLRTVAYWDAGRYRVPWTVIRMLRLYRNFDLGGLSAEWDGFRMMGGTLYTPEGYAFTGQDFRAWWWQRQELWALRARMERQKRQDATARAKDGPRAGPDGLPSMDRTRAHGRQSAGSGTAERGIDAAGEGR